MSEPPVSEQPGDQWPPDWIEEAARSGRPGILDTWASTTRGSLYLAVWRAFPDATTFEQGWAAARAPGHDWVPSPRDAVARIAALREARRQRPDLSDDTWQELVADIVPKLSEGGRQDPEAILVAVQRKIHATIEVSRTALEADRRADKSRRRLRLEGALERCSARGQRAPTQAEIAAACRPQITERTVRRWLHEEPELRDLLPWLSRATDEMTGE